MEYETTTLGRSRTAEDAVKTVSDPTDTQDTGDLRCMVQSHSPSESEKNRRLPYVHSRKPPTELRVLDELVYDTDANLTNVLIGEDWKIWKSPFYPGIPAF